MRKQVQKERCTKIMLTKCKAVCCLYDKVQLAAAKMLDAEPAIFQIECNVPILCNDIPANDLNLPSETYTTDFVLHYDDGHTAIREAVFRSYLSRPSVAEKLELSRRTGNTKEKAGLIPPILAAARHLRLGYHHRQGGYQP